jgi:hypothetical protein
MLKPSKIGITPFYLWPLWILCAPHDVVALAKERYAALECQNSGKFVLVNFFPDQTYQMTWGSEDKITQQDINVRRLQSADMETYADDNLSLTLPAGGTENSTVPRIAEFRVFRPIPSSWQGLRCYLYGAD